MEPQTTPTKPTVKIVGENANPFDIMRRVSEAMKGHYSEEEIEQYRREATEGDIAHLLIVSAKYVNTEQE